MSYTCRISYSNLPRSRTNGGGRGRHRHRGVIKLHSPFTFRSMVSENVQSPYEEEEEEQQQLRSP